MPNLDNVLNHDEQVMLLYIVNEIKPVDLPEGIKFNMNSVKWFNPELLVKRLIDAEPAIKDEHKVLFDGMMAKLGIKVERNPK